MRDWLEEQHELVESLVGKRVRFTDQIVAKTGGYVRTALGDYIEGSAVTLVTIEGEVSGWQITQGWPSRVEVNIVGWGSVDARKCEVIDEVAR